MELHVPLAYLYRIQCLPNVCLAYKPYVGVRNFFKNMLKILFYLAVCQRMLPCFKRIQPMPNAPLAYVSVYQRMSDIFHTLTYASTIRYSVTGPLTVHGFTWDMIHRHVTRDISNPWLILSNYTFICHNNNIVQSSCP
jgi:hypothetical protein